MVDRYRFTLNAEAELSLSLGWDVNDTWMDPRDRPKPATELHWAGHLSPRSFKMTSSVICRHRALVLVINDYFLPVDAQYFPVTGGELSPTSC